jgi:cytoskeleton protein RodZ
MAGCSGRARSVRTGRYEEEDRVDTPRCPRCASDLVARTRAADVSAPLDEEWRWFCSSCGHEWAPQPAPTESATLAIENARGGWLARVRGHDVRHHAVLEPLEAPADDPADGPSSTDSYGDRLRETREERGRSLADAAASTGIRERYLRALEGEEPPEVFSAPAYARFFLREYADALDLSAGPLLEAFDRRYPLQAEETVPASRTAIRDPGPRRRITAVTLVSLSVVALVAIAVAAGSRGDDEQGALGTAPANAIVTTTPPPPDDAGNGDSTPPVRHIRAVLRFDAPCWVQATTDGETTVARTVGTGERLVVRGDRRVVLELGNAGGVRLTVNGASAATGASGDVTTLTFRIRAGEIVSSTA